MTQEQVDSVVAKLSEIRQCQERYAADMKRLRSELIAHALFFETYAEMYAFIRKHTPTLEDFCLDMLEAREIWFKKQDKQGGSGGYDYQSKLSGL